MEEEVVLHVREITQRRAPTFAVLGLADQFFTLSADSECVSDENWCGGNFTKSLRSGCDREQATS